MTSRRSRGLHCSRDWHQTITDNEALPTETNRNRRLCAVRFDVTLSSCCVGPTAVPRQSLTLARAMFYSGPSGVRRHERSAAGNAIRARDALRNDSPKTARQTNSREVSPRGNRPISLNVGRVPANGVA